MVEKLILDGFGSDLLVEQINASPTKKLIYELNYKYGLKVLTTTQPPEHYSVRPLEFVMCLPDSGFAVAKVWTIESAGEIEYNYRSPYYEKERGNSREDRETLHSKKLSSLMATLKRNDVVANNDYIFSDTINNTILGVEESIRQSYGKSHKHNPLGGEELHALLKGVIGGNTNGIDFNLCKELLDKYEKIDRMKEECSNELNRFLGKEMLLIGADRFDHLVIGSVKREAVSGDEYKYSIVKPFKRYRSVHEREDLIPMLTMLKVHTEGSAREWFGNFIPRSSGFLKDLDMILYCRKHPDAFNFQWVATPC
jgi:hypothetical protein